MVWHFRPQKLRGFTGFKCASHSITAAMPWKHESWWFETKYFWISWEIIGWHASDEQKISRPNMTAKWSEVRYYDIYYLGLQVTKLKRTHGLECCWIVPGNSFTWRWIWNGPPVSFAICDRTPDVAHHQPFPSDISHKLMTQIQSFRRLISVTYIVSVRRPLHADLQCSNVGQGIFNVLRNSCTGSSGRKCMTVLQSMDISHRLDRTRKPFWS